MQAGLMAMLPLVLLILLGYGLGRRTGYFRDGRISGLVSAVGLPALILVSLLALPSGLGPMLNLMAAVLVWLVVMAMITALVLVLLDVPVGGYLPALVNPNAAYLGAPLCAALFGPAVLATVMVFSVVVQFSHCTLGVLCLQGRIDWRGLRASRPLWALLLALVIRALDWQVPVVISQLLEMLARITVPLMLLQLGASLSQLSLAGGWGVVWRPFWLATFRCVVGALVAMSVLAWWPLPEDVFWVCVVLAAMPVAVVSYAMAVEYRGPADDIAWMILFSLPLSLLVVMGLRQVMQVWF